MAQGFAVAVKIVDLATAPITRINRSIQSLQKSATQVARQGGLFEARDALRRIGDQAKEVGDGLAKVFSPLGGLTAAGSIGGLALLEERFARVGSEIARTSSTLGLNTDDLQKWRGAADLAGVGAEAMTSSIAGAARGIYLMRNGLNPDMFRVVQRWGLDANKGATDAEKAANLILQVSNKIRTDPSLRNNAQAQRTLLGQLGIDERMLWLMQQGKEKIEEFAEASKRHAYLTQEQTNQAMELQFAYNGLQQSVGGFTNAVAAEMSKWMTPTLKGFSDWIDKLRQSPDAMSKVQIGVEALAAVFGVTMVAGIVKLIATLNAFWALPAIRFLLSPLGAGVLAAIAGGYALKGITPPEDAQRWLDEAHKDKSGQAPGAPGWWSKLRKWFSGTPDVPHRRHGDLHIGMSDQARIGDATRAYEKMGWTHEQASAIAANQFAESGLRNIAGDSGLAQGFGQWHPDRQANFHRLFGKDLRNATADEQYAFTNWELHNTEKAAGDRLRQTTTAAAGGDILSRYYERPRDQEGEAGARASLAERFARMFAPIGPALAAPAVPLPPQVPPSAPGQQGSLNLDSSHRVEVAFVNAPPGMRSGLTRAEGPAEVSVRTHYSMDGLS